MGLYISSDRLREAGLDERDALTAFACRMFQGKKLEMWPAARMAGLERVEMEGEFRKRGIAIYSPTIGDLHEDVETMRKLGARVVSVVVSETSPIRALRVASNHRRT